MFLIISIQTQDTVEAYKDASQLNGEEEPLTGLCLQKRSVGGLCVFVRVVIYRTYYYSSQDVSLWLSIASL